ncbi:phage protease [Novosphingobium naphthalenivorans]|uniref:phage protease n=1 Tax=Novosphingobium naphthalenivorans TaxID=273168 RepID=UPI00083173A8|nr:phage protease [Novosphingobium naphthalenivorans]
MTQPALSEIEGSTIASAIELDAQGKAPRRMKLLPYGTYRGRDGRGPYVLEPGTHAEQVIAATRDYYGGNDMMVDYDHQSALAAVPGVGGTARASGWIKTGTLTAEADGIWADVEWTEMAAAAIENKEYRYHSPWFFRHPETGRITRIRNAGLTNSPNLDLPALASAQGGASGESEPMTQIALAPLVTALALSANAGEAEVLAAIGGLKDKAQAGETVLASARATLGLGADADGEAVLAAVGTAVEGAKAGEPDPRKWVPKAGFDELKGRVDKLDEDRVLAMVDAASSGDAPKLTPAMRDWAIKLGKRDIGELQSFLDTAPAFEGAKSTVKGEPPAAEKGKLTEEEAEICAAMGMTKEDFLKTRDEEEAL